MLKTSKDKGVGVGLTKKEEDLVNRMALKEGVSKARMLEKIHTRIIDTNFADTLEVKEIPKNNYFRTSENLANKLAIKCSKLKRSVSEVFREYLADLED